MKEKITIWLAWHMPRSLARWAYIRVATSATVGEYDDTEVGELTVFDALERWQD